jgi:hypothetical protein
MEIILQANRIQKQATFISENADFKSKLLRRDKECHRTIIKGTIYQEGKMILKIS